MELLYTFLCRIAVGLGIVQKPILIVKFLAEHPVPDNIQAGVVYIIRSSGFQKWAMFLCPRHENEIIQLCLMRNRRPHWTVKTDLLGRPTINPSVRQLKGSFAHFWVKAGHIEWCSDSGRAYNISRNWRV